MFGCRIAFFGLFLVSVVSNSQVKNLDLPFSKLDSLYREDQFYCGISVYNRLQNTPLGFVQNGFPISVSVGFLRDMPLNKNRTIAVAFGFGFAYNKYYQNLKFTDNLGGVDVQLVDNASFGLNKLEQIFVEFPLELRWRNSTPQSHKFYRIYGGFKLQYLLFDKTKFVSDSFTSVLINNHFFNKLQFGPTLSLGQNTWNGSIFYGLNGMFKNESQMLDIQGLNSLNIGLMFYIL